MHTNINTLFENLWQNYIQVTPTAPKIHELLGSSQKDDIINDHIALRTFNFDNTNLEKLAMHFKVLGYKEGDEYFFKTKKLHAKHYEHEDDSYPKVFISELLVEEFSQFTQNTLKELTKNIDEEIVLKDNFLYSGTHWKIDSKTYEKLLEESEYAAWISAWGYRANHFTVNINKLKNYETIFEVNEVLKNAGFELNCSGGEIKGNPEVLLEQSSTLADKFEVEFLDKKMEIPSCFYEFALRYKTDEGKLYSGFVEASANKIFESTNKR